jgi:histidinol-phosphatase
VNPWDAAALSSRHHGSGRRVHHWGGQHTAFGGDIIATNAALAGAVRDRLQEDWP